MSREELAKPFDPRDLEFKPGAMNKEKTRAVPLAFVTWTKYADRLDASGMEWEVHIDQIIGQGTETVISLTLILGGAGYPGVSDPTVPTHAFDQAFKRACTLAGLGRYLYQLENTWMEYNSQDYRKPFGKTNLQLAVESYRRAGIEVAPEIVALAAADDKASMNGNTGTSGQMTKFNPGTLSPKQQAFLAWKGVPENVIQSLSGPAASELIGLLKNDVDVDVALVELGIEA